MDTQVLLYCWTPGLTLRRCTSPEAQTPRPSHFRRRQLRHHHLGSIHHPNTLCFAFVTLLLRSSCILLISVLRACSSLVSGCPVLPAPSSLRLYDTVSPDKTFVGQTILDPQSWTLVSQTIALDLHTSLLLR